MIVCPSGATAQLHMLPSPVKVAICSPLSRSQTRSVRSSEPETARCPSGVTAKALIQPVWPSSVRSAGCSRGPTPSAFGHASPTRRGARRADRQGPDLFVWPSSVRELCPLSRSHTRKVWSSEADTARRPSGVTATALTQRLMAFERAQRLSALEVPHPQRSVLRARHSSAPIRRYRHGTDRYLPSSVSSDCPLSRSHTRSA